MNRTLARRLLVLMALIGALAGCGQKGDLYLPDEPPAREAARADG